MRYAIRYRTEYDYAGTVEDQHNALRVQPVSDAGQRLERFSLTTEPNARQHRYTDYFGTEVIEFNIPEEHERIVMEANARVDRYQPPAPTSGSWEGLAEPAYRETGGEFLIHAEDEPSHVAIDVLHEQTEADSPIDSVRALCAAIPDRFEYRKGATFVASTVDDLLAGGAGVCQDFVHLALILLRRRGIAARYVSGYLFAVQDESQDSAEVNTHAWVEALVPNGADGPVWVGADPTNRALVGDRHVKIGHGRHYGDVPPIKGVYRGARPAGHDVRVTMTRLDPI